MKKISKIGERSRVQVSVVWLARGMLVLPVLLGLFLFSFEKVKAEQTDPAKTIIGKATVVVADDFEHGRSERWYYITDQVTGERVRLYFDGVPPASFLTGAQFEARIVPVQDGFRPLDLTDITPGNLDSSIESQQLDAEPYRGAVLTILVDFNDARVGGPGVDWGVTIQDAKGFMFNDVQSVAGLFESASLGTVLLDPDKNSDGQPDVFGPYEIDASINEEYCPVDDWMDKATAAWQADNPSIDSSSYQHIVYILPNYRDFPSSCWWRGIASVSCEQCIAVSRGIGKSPVAWIPVDVGLITAHEIGHNFNFNHAASDTNNNGIIERSRYESEYGDISDIMGWATGTGAGWVKLNGPHADWASWTDPQIYEIRSTNQTLNPQLFELLSMDDEALDWPGLRGIKLPRDAQSTYFATYRSNAGIYDQVPHVGDGVPNGWADRINIHYRYHSYHFWANYSFFVTSIGPGESFSDSNADLRIIAGEQQAITDGKGHSTQVMGVEICHFDCGETKIAVDVVPDELLACIEGNNVDLDPLTLSVKSIDGVSEMVSLDFASELPSELTGTISPKAVASSSEGTMSVASFTFAGNPTPLTDVIRIEGFPENGYPRGVDIFVGVYDDKPGSVELSAPEFEDPSSDIRPAFSWTPSDAAYEYLLEIATDSDFKNLWTRERVKRNEFTPGEPLPLGTQFYWRVTPINACGSGQQSSTGTFTTATEGRCSQGEEAVYIYKEDFESKSSSWLHDAEEGPDLWELVTEEFFSPSQSWKATLVGFASDQRLTSPLINIQSTPGTPKLEFFSRIDFTDEGLPDYCHDGGILEYSVDRGETWEQMPMDRLETNPYRAVISKVSGNPLDLPYGNTRLAWCGKHGWLRNRVDLAGFEQQPIKLRFRLGTGSYGEPGSWHIDDISLYSCVSSELIHIFKDGFEPGEK